MAEQSTETQLLDLLAKMTTESLEASSLDERMLMLVRIAALVAVDAPPVSYLLNLEVAGEVGVDEEQVRGSCRSIVGQRASPRPFPPRGTQSRQE